MLYARHYDLRNRAGLVIAIKTLSLRPIQALGQDEEPNITGDEPARGHVLMER
jgi:hypothetical protein